MLLKYDEYILVLSLFKMITISMNIKAEFLSFEEFRKCVSVLGFGEPLNQTYVEFTQKSRKIGNISSKLESLMALTHFMIESNAFTIKSDPICSHTNQTHLCEIYKKEVNCPSNNTYYKRGFIGLKYCYNYRDVSNELYGDQRLVFNPNIVSESNEEAMDTALTYWKIKVHDKILLSRIESGLFGYTTDLLGREECTKDITKAKKKWIYFNECLEESGNGNLKRSEEGCYAIVNLKSSDFVNLKSSTNTTLITASVGSVILLVLIFILLFVFMRRIKKLSEVNEVITSDDIYDDINSDISINSVELNKDYDYASIGGDDYECMDKYEKLSLKSLNTDIYLPMNKVES